MEKTLFQEFPALVNAEDNLQYAWYSFTSILHKPVSIWYACNGKLFLDNQHIYSANETDLFEKKYQKCIGYHIIAMVFLWNNWFEEAYELENHFLLEEYWLVDKELHEQYIEMLILKRRKDKLDILFENENFKNKFFSHYEVFISVFINPNYLLVKKHEMIFLFNKINKLCIGYGEPSFMDLPYLKKT